MTFEMKMTTMTMMTADDDDDDNDDDDDDNDDAQLRHISAFGWGASSAVGELHPLTVNEVSDSFLSPKQLCNQWQRGQHFHSQHVGETSSRFMEMKNWREDVLRI